MKWYLIDDFIFSVLMVSHLLNFSFSTAGPGEAGANPGQGAKSTTEQLFTHSLFFYTFEQFKVAS